jgi:hypothetical protein
MKNVFEKEYLKNHTRQYIQTLRVELDKTESDWVKDKILQLIAIGELELEGYNQDAESN